MPWLLPVDRDPMHDDVCYIGDSLCSQIHSDPYHTGKHFVDIASVGANCQGGRKLMEIEAIPSRCRVAFMAHVTNDVGRTDLAEFTAHYQHLLDTFQGERIYCVLPQEGLIRGIDSTPYADAIKSICANTIQPSECGVQYRAPDGRHWTKEDHAAFAPCVSERI